MANFNPSDFTPINSASSAGSNFNPIDFSPVDTQKSSGFFGPTEDTLNRAINNDSESVSDFATRKAKQSVFGIGAIAPATAGDLNNGPGTLNPDEGQDWGVLGGLKIPAKTAANVLSDVPNLVADVGNFAWQTFAHPWDTAKSIAADPIGFAEGMVGDLITQPIEGFATGIKDLIQGKGAGKAADDIGQSFQKAMIAFIDRPITSIIQFKLAKGLATDPVGTIKTVAKDTIDMGTKPWQFAYNFAKDPKQAVTDVANTVQAKYDAIKNFPNFFTKDGQAKIAQGLGNQIMEYAQSNLKITDLQDKLKSLDKGSEEYTKTQNEINMHQQKVDNAQQSISLLTSHFADKTGETFSKGGYSDTKDFTADTQGVVDGLYKTKDYAGVLNPGGKPVVVSDVAPVTDYLKSQGAKLEAQGNPDSAAFNQAAAELELRHKITQAGGMENYIQSEAQAKMTAEGIDAAKNPAKATLAREKYAQEVRDEVNQKIASKPSFYSRPLTADDLFSYMNNLGEKMKSNFGSKLIADQNTENPTAKSITMETIGKDLSKVDPNATEKLAQENKKFSDLKNTWDKWGSKTFDNIGSLVKWVTSDKNWSDFQKFPQEIVSKFQNTLASFIVDSARKSDGTMDFNKLSNLTEQYASNLTPNHTGTLSELSYANNLPQNVHNTESISNDLKTIMQAKGELSASEAKLTETEIKAAQAKADMNVVGTTPEKIATNLKGIQTMDDLNSFMKAANIKDPRVLGDLITGTLFDQMQQQFGEYKGLNFKNMGELVKQVREIGNKSPLGQQLKDTLFSPEKQKALEVLEEQSNNLTKMFEDSGFNPAAKRMFHAAFGAVASVLGWHVTSIRNFYEAIKPGKAGEETKAPNEVNLDKMGKKSKNEGIIPRIIKAIPKITPGAEGVRKVKENKE